VVEEVVVSRVWMFSEVQLVMECLKMCSRTGRKRVLNELRCLGF
jgi:hypothetical protein